MLTAPALLVRNAFGPTAGPRVLRWYFETCGGGYVKVGQSLATRYDLLRADYTEELGKLSTRCRRFPPREGMEPLPFRDLSGFEQEIKQSLQDYLIASRDPNAPLSQKSTGSFLLRTLATLRRNRLPMTSSTVHLYRTILIADIVMLGLYPSIDWRGHLRRFLRDFSSDLIEQAVAQPLTSPYTGYRLARAPMTVADTMEWLMRRLPDIGHQTLRTLSASERLIPHALRLLRGRSASGSSP